MSAGQKDGTGAMTTLHDEKVYKDEIMSNRDKAQRPPGQSLDSKGVQVDEYKDIPASRRSLNSDQKTDEVVGPLDENKPELENESGQIDRAGFDLGGSTGKTKAGKGLGLGTDAKEDKKSWRLRD